ncbi:MAG TPA: DnaJ domain-containing protein [Thermoanaerobaculia bacterium]|jgi:curved DNA-binding protein CbpA
MFQNVDYYALLGVGREASETEIRERFRALARDAHPDRAPRDLKAEAEAKFQELTQAVNVLTNEERRRAYDRALTMAASARGSADAVVQDYLELGGAAYHSGAYAEAAGNFALAAQRDPKDVRAHHYLGLASARAGDLRAAVKALEAAVALDPHNVTLLKDAGRIFRQAGLLAKAEKAFQDAVRWDPAATDARKAVEEIRAERAVKA